MKKITLFLAAGLFAITASAQKVQESQVAPAAKATFTKMHPGVTVEQWEKEGNNWEAEFHAGKIETTVVLGPNGQFLQTEVEISVSGLPKAAVDYIATNAGGKKATEATKITDVSGTVSYEAEVDKMDYYFNATGIFVKKEADTDTDDDDKK